ncbi:hypothetical protein CHS0354_022598 [Potamilus streckersoni]|uniref:Uncharacterized protein n=1 Tax=Potamilus streckersoni TaxID=2493646 RepID=A0AAE0S6L7_9BIVA|nr:hypothetical protein CHS0354_022598 [Potamilus streckersoni]
MKWRSYITWNGRNILHRNSAIFKQSCIPYERGGKEVLVAYYMETGLYSNTFSFIFCEGWEGANYSVTMLHSKSHLYYLRSGFIVHAIKQILEFVVYPI